MLENQQLYMLAIVINLVTLTMLVMYIYRNYQYKKEIEKENAMVIKKRKEFNERLKVPSIKTDEQYKFYMEQQEHYKVLMEPQKESKCNNKI